MKSGELFVPLQPESSEQEALLLEQQSFKTSGMNNLNRVSLHTLPDAHASLDDVDDIVTQLFALIDEVHIDGADGIGVLMVVDVVDVLRLQLVTEIVDFVLNVEGTVHVVRLLAATHQLVHLSQGVVSKAHHLVQMAVLLVVEMILLAIVFAGNGAGHVVAGIADGLQFTHLTQHGADLTLRVIREVGVADVLKVFGNLQLHVVADALVFLDTRVELVELSLFRVLLVGGTAGKVQQILHHAEHALHTL